MRFRALAVDYDGTLATHGHVPDDVLDALRSVRSSGRRLLLVTGRHIDDLQTTFPRLDLFDRVVAENGAVVYQPDKRQARVLAEPPPSSFVDQLRARGVDPLHVGHVVVATFEPHSATVVDTIRDQGLELHVVFNKGAVMVLPSGLNKRFGLLEALGDLGLSPHNVVGVGDAENDHAFLDACECSVAVANALPAIKARADLVTDSTHGQGVIELIERLLTDDLGSLESRLKRHRILFGQRAARPKRVQLQPFGTGLLVAGSSKAGKSSLVLGLLERLQEHGYQYCVLDPEGDYERLDGAVNLGDPRHAPTPETVAEVLEDPTQNACVSLLGVDGSERPAYFAALREALAGLWRRTGRPHWLIVDEAHHVVPADIAPQELTESSSVVLVTLDPARLAASVFPRLNVVCAVGKDPRRTLNEAAVRLGVPPPRAFEGELRKGQALVWRRGKQRAHLVGLAAARTKRRRHRRKYAEGELPPDLSFYFRGPDSALELRAQNLHLFMQIGDGVDDATWQHHLRAGDYSRWVAEVLKDTTLAEQIASVERQGTVPIEHSRAAVRRLIERRYAPPA